MQGFFSKKEAELSTGSLKKPLSCVSCGLYKDIDSPKMQISGNGNKRIMNIGPAPTESDDRKGKHWTGQSGRFLRRSLMDFDIDIDEDCWNINAVQCHPANVKGKSTNIPQHSIDCCRRTVENYILKYQPDIILLWGIDAVKSIIGNRWTRDLGGIDKWRGWTIPDQKYKAWVCPIFDPTMVAREQDKPEVKTVWKLDIQNALQKLNEQVPDHTDEPVYLFEKEEGIQSVLDKVENSDMFAFDYETTGLKPHNTDEHEIATVSFCMDSNRTYCIPVPNMSEMQLQQLRNIMENPNIGKIAANMKYEHTWTKNILGADVQGWNFDTQQAAHVLDNRPGITSLKFQTAVQFGIFGYEDEVSQYLKSKEPKNANSTNRVMEVMQNADLRRKLMYYCALDSYYTWKLAARQKTEMTTALWRAYDLIHNGILALARAEQQGMRIDTDYIKKQKKKLDRKIARYEKQIFESQLITEWRKKYGQKFNLNSTTQLGDMLYNERGLLPAKKTATGKGSTDEESLRTLGIPEINKLLDIRKMQKVKDTYLENFLREQVNDYLHPFFNLHTVVTYRSSSNSPNFQNIPKRDKEAMTLTRSAIFPRPGHQLMELDFSKLEVSIAACYHKDTTMMEYLRSDHNDMHGDLAAQIFKIDNFDKHRKDHALLRSATKNSFIFPQFYGDYYGNNAEALCGWVKLPHGKWKKAQGIEMEEGYISNHMISVGIKSYDQFVQHMKEIEDDFWNNRFMEYGKWKVRWWKKYQKRGYFDMYTGFRCQGVMGKNNALNYPVQGAAFHCLLWVLIEVDKMIFSEGWKSRIIGQIHDALILDVHPDELEDIGYRIKEIATIKLPEAWHWIIAPLGIDAELCPIDGSFATKEDYELPKIN
jgi:DNA polymerase-1